MIRSKGTRQTRSENERISVLRHPWTAYEMWFNALPVREQRLTIIGSVAIGAAIGAVTDMLT